MTDNYSIITMDRNTAENNLVYLESMLKKEISDESQSTRHKSFVWEYFGYKIIYDDLGNRSKSEEVIVCKVCESEYNFVGNTTNMATHLRRHHNIHKNAVTGELNSLVKLEDNKGPVTPEAKNVSDSNISSLENVIKIIDSKKRKSRLKISNTFSLDSRTSMLGTVPEYTNQQQNTNHIRTSTRNILITEKIGL